MALFVCVAPVAQAQDPIGQQVGALDERVEELGRVVADRGEKIATIEREIARIESVGEYSESNASRIDELQQQLDSMKPTDRQKAVYAQWVEMAKRVEELGMTSTEFVDRVMTVTEMSASQEVKITDLMTGLADLEERITKVERRVGVVETDVATLTGAVYGTEESTGLIEDVRDNMSAIDDLSTRGFCLDFSLGGFAGGGPFGQAAQAVFAPLQFRGVRAGLQLGAGIGYCTDKFRVGFEGGFIFDIPDHSIGGYGQVSGLWRVSDSMFSIGPTGRFEYLERRYRHGLKDGQDVIVQLGPRVRVDFLRKQDGVDLALNIDALIGWQGTSVGHSGGGTAGRVTGGAVLGFTVGWTDRR